MNDAINDLRTVLDESPNRDSATSMSGLSVTEFISVSTTLATRSIPSTKGAMYCGKQRRE